VRIFHVTFWKISPPDDIPVGYGPPNPEAKKCQGMLVIEATGGGGWLMNFCNLFWRRLESVFGVAFTVFNITWRSFHLKFLSPSRPALYNVVVYSTSLVPTAWYPVSFGFLCKIMFTEIAVPTYNITVYCRYTTIRVDTKWRF
jgi:hypothetical protein